MMKRMILLSATLAAIAAAPATRPATRSATQASPTSRPAATRPTVTHASVPLTPEMMLQSVPREFGPKASDDNRGKDNAVGWMTRKYADQTVTLSGWASKANIDVERSGTIATVVVRSQRPTRWLTMRMSVICILKLPVSDDEAARLVKLPEGRPATVELKLERIEATSYVKTPTELSQDKKDEDDRKRTGHEPKSEPKDDSSAGFEFVGTIEKYSLK